jgi:hypothetical protein
MQSSGATPLARARRMVAAAVLAGVMTLAADAAPAMADPVLAGQWRFDEGAGQVAVDDGPSGLHGELGAGAQADGDDPLRIDGASGGGLRFGGGSYVRVSDGKRLDLQRVTVETVARAATSPGAYRYLVVHGSRDCFAGAYGLYTAANGGLAFYVFDGQRYFVSASAPAEEVWNGAWHRLTGTFDGERVRAFVDGREVGAALSTPHGTAIEFESMPEGTYFGSYVGACRLPFIGDVDSVRIWSDASSPAAVAEQAGVAPGAAVAPGAGAAVIAAKPPKSTCSVRASRTQIRAGRRVALTVRATGPSGPLRRVRLSVRHANARTVIVAPRTNAKGSVKVTLRIGKRGRLRIGIAGRASCTPAFITVK